MTVRFDYDLMTSVVEDETDCIYLIHKILTEALCNHHPHGLLLRKHEIGISHPLVDAEGRPYLSIGADGKRFELRLGPTAADQFLAKEVTDGPKET